LRFFIFGLFDEMINLIEVIRYHKGE